MFTPTIILSLCACSISFLAFCVSVYTVLGNQKQKRIDNLITLHGFLHREDLSEARRYVREQLKEPTLVDPNVRRVLSSFDFAGTLVRHKAVDQKMFLDYWRTPLLALADPLAPMAGTITGKGITVRDYYRDFWWLIEKAKVEREQF